MNISNLPTRELRDALPQSPRRPVAKEVDKMLASSPEQYVGGVDSRLNYRSESLHRSESGNTTGATVCLAAATAVLAHGAFFGGFGAGHALLMGGLAVGAWAMLRTARSSEKEATKVEISERMLRAEADGYLAHHTKAA